MVEKKKRTAEEASLDSASSCEDLKTLCNEVMTAAVIETDHLKRMKSLLKRIGKEPDGKEIVQTTVDNRVITSLLIAYNAMRTENDLKIYDILLKLERKFVISLGQLQPLLWGPEAREHYQKLASLGSTLHRIAPNQVLNNLDPMVVWNTVKNHSRQEVPDIYDERFLLQLFAFLLQPGSEVSCTKFIEKNCLALVFSCTSSKCEETRLLAYYNLQRFLSLLLELKEEKFAEKALFVYVLRLFKQSIAKEAPRISHLVSLFFARVTKLMLHPESPAYGQIFAFLCQKPQVDLNSVPEFYKLLLSTSVEYYKEEREWILQHIAESIIDPIDYNVLQNSTGIKLLLSLFSTCIVDQKCRGFILKTLKAAVSIQSAAYDLFHRCNLHSWIALNIKNARLTRWERNFLAQIFVILLNNEKLAREGKGAADDKITLAMAKLAAQSVNAALAELINTEAESVSQQHLDALATYFQK